MSKTKHDAFDDSVLERFLDGTLDNMSMQALEQALVDDDELRARVDEMVMLRSVLHEHVLGAADDVDFTGLSDRVLERIEQTEALPWLTRLQNWTAEVFAYRKNIWVPSLAMAGAAAAVLFFVLPQTGVQPAAVSPEVRMANAGVEVRSLNTGTQLAMVYKLPASSTTVIWINDNGDTAEGTLQ